MESVIHCRAFALIFLYCSDVRIVLNLDNNYLNLELAKTLSQSKSFMYQNSLGIRRDAGHYRLVSDVHCGYTKNAKQFQSFH